MILYEDNHLLVVNKRRGELVQGDQTGDDTLLSKYKAYIKNKYEKKGNVFLHPLHRLDRPVSGALILGRTSKALSRVSQQFKNGTVEKTYLALTANSMSLSEGILENYISKDRKKNRSKITKTQIQGSKYAKLSYRIKKRVRDYYLYEIIPVTGRSHQIRVQLANESCPIVGDVKYGGLKINDPKMIYLHCHQMTFIHPTTKEKVKVSCLPEHGDLWQQFL